MMTDAGFLYATGTRATSTEGRSTNGTAQPETANPVGNGAPGPSVGERNAEIGEKAIEAVRPEIERSAVDAYKARLREKLSQVKELAVGDEKVIPGIADYKDNEKSVKDYFTALETNINFVNTLRQELKKQ